jgi:GAF domain-containing protein
MTISSPVKMAQTSDNLAGDAAQQVPQLAEAAEMILRAMSLTELWTAVANAHQAILKPDALAICYYNPDNLAQVETYGRNLPDRFLSRSASRPALWRKQRTISASPEPEMATPVQQFIQAEGFQTAVVSPFIADGQHQGGIMAYWQTAVSPTPDQVRAAQLLAHMATITTQNIRLFAAQNRALQREQQLNEFSRVLNEMQDLPSILSYVARIATELTNANRGSLGLIVSDQVMMFYPFNMPTSTSLRPQSRGHGLAWEVAESGQPIMLDDYPAHPLAEAEIVNLGTNAFLGVPIVVRGDVCLGTISLFKVALHDPFRLRDLELVESLARQAGVAIQNSRLYAEFEQRANALANALARQEELDKLKSLFVQNVSHELRTPLGIIYGHAELLESGTLGELHPDQQESIQIIARRARMLTDLVEDLTALLAAETQEFRRELIDPIQLITALVDDYQLQAKAVGLQLAIVLPQQSPVIQGAANQRRTSSTR